jgi:hypothetical protein
MGHTVQTLMMIQVQSTTLNPNSVILSFLPINSSQNDTRIIVFMVRQAERYQTRAVLYFVRSVPPGMR